MINIFVTYRCNLACPYCFARELHREHPEDLRWEDFEKLLAWMKQSGQHAAAFIGGEPTLHPELARMIKATANAGIDVVLFTNGLSPSELAFRLAPLVSNFVVNHNASFIYANGQEKRFHENLALLRDQGARVTFSKNFAPDCLEYDALLTDAQRYKVRAIRYDISRPSGEGENDFIDMPSTRRLMPHIVNFVRACEAVGIRTGLDCCVRMCDVPTEDRAYLQRVSMKFTGTCHPSIDVHPNLSASYCLPMKHVCVDDVTAFSDAQELMYYFSGLVRPTRFAHADDACTDCKEFKRTCQGGCMALKAQATRTPAHTTNPLTPLAMHETNKGHHVSL